MGEVYGGKTVALGVQGRKRHRKSRGNKVYVPLTAKNRGSTKNKQFEVTKKRLLRLCCAGACCGAAISSSGSRKRQEAGLAEHGCQAHTFLLFNIFLFGQKFLGHLLG